MGHVESGGSTAEQAQLNSAEPQGPPRRPSDVGLWSTWRNLTRLFPSWSFLLNGLTTPGAWTS